MSSEPLWPVNPGLPHIYIVKVKITLFKFFPELFYDVKRNRLYLDNKSVHCYVPLDFEFKVKLGQAVNFLSIELITCALRVKVERCAKRAQKGFV